MAVAADDEVLRFIDGQALFGRGIGYVDAHLLAAARLTSAPNCGRTIGACTQSRPSWTWRNTVALIGLGELLRAVLDAQDDRVPGLVRHNFSG